MIFMVLKAPRKRAVGRRIIRNASDCHHLHGFGNGPEGGGRVQNHEKYIGPSSFSCLSKWVVGVRVASES